MKPECICLTGDPTQCPCRTEAEIRSDENHKRFKEFMDNLLTNMAIDKLMEKEE